MCGDQKERLVVFDFSNLLAFGLQLFVLQVRSRLELIHFFCQIECPIIPCPISIPTRQFAENCLANISTPRKMAA